MQMPQVPNPDFYHKKFSHSEDPQGVEFILFIFLKSLLNYIFNGSTSKSKLKTSVGSNQ